MINIHQMTTKDFLNGMGSQKIYVPHYTTKQNSKLPCALLIKGHKFQKRVFVSVLALGKTWV